jgi:predicted transglutaminase-like cysteine proteinase
MRGEFATHRRLSTALLVLGLAALGCASVLTPNIAHYRYFEAPAADDPWSPKIAAWQIRDRNGNATARANPSSELAPRPVSDGLQVRRGQGLRSKYEGFQADRKRRTAREFMEWIQAQASEHYIADGPVDHWATLEETLRGDGDDCDGLELLVFHALRDQGFAEDEVYRAVVHRASDGQHHMVTLWFESPDDPWVIDPTGAMTRRFLRMSQLPEWAPLKVFNDRREYTVRGHSGARLASNP